MNNDQLYDRFVELLKTKYPTFTRGHIVNVRTESVPGNKTLDPEAKDEVRYVLIVKDPSCSCSQRVFFSQSDITPLEEAKK
jgi:hypothetical protein